MQQQPTGCRFLPVLHKRGHFLFNESAMSPAISLPIRFNYQNALQTHIGEHGLAPGEISPSTAVDAVRVFRTRVDTGDIGFPNLPLDQNTSKEILQAAEELRGEIDSVLVLGIGGSALGPAAVDSAIHGPHPMRTGLDSKPLSPRRNPQLVVMDNVDPGFVAATLTTLHPKRTAVCVIAKSGNTAETLSTFMVTHEWLTKAVGGRKAAKRIFAITDEHKGDLLAIAKQEKYTTFFVPGNVGGRYSVFSPVGLMPLALTGLDIAKMLRGAKDANAACWSGDFNANPALQSAAIHHGLDTKRGKRVEIVFAYSSYLWGAAFWYRQLWAESLGKKVNRKGELVNTGQTPVAALGVTDQHSQVQLYTEGPHDKMITFWAVERPRIEVRIPSDKRFAKFDSTGYLQGKTIGQLFHAERAATEAALTEAGRPNCRWTLPRVDEYHIGMFFQVLEFQTAFAGELYGIDAFDQPGVELAKKLTNGLMGKKGFEEYAQRFKKGA
jgi:glucose-6-phosphate isomerase